MRSSRTNTASICGYLRKLWLSLDRDRSRRKNARRAAITWLKPSAYRPALWPHIQSVFVSGTAFDELCAAQQAPRQHTHGQVSILLRFRIALEQERKKKCLSQNLLAAALRRRLQPAWRPSGCSAHPRNPPMPTRAIWSTPCPRSSGPRLAARIHRKQGRPSCPSDGSGPASNR